MAQLNRESVKEGLQRFGPVKLRIEVARLHKRVAELNLGLGLGSGLPIDRRGARQYQVLDAVARERRQRLGEHGIEPAAGEVGIDRDREVFVSSLGVLHERSQLR